MTTAEFSATAGTVHATAQSASVITKTIADAATLDTDVDTVVTDMATAIAAYKTFAAAVIAITGDTFSNTTLQFTFGGSTGLTHAQWATEGALLNTAMTDFLTAQTDATTAQTASDTVQADAALISNDMNVYVGSVSNIGDRNVLRDVLRRLERVMVGTGLFAVGSGNPRTVPPELL